MPRALRSGPVPDRRGSASTSAGLSGLELDRVAVGLGALARQVGVADHELAKGGGGGGGGGGFWGATMTTVQAATLIAPYELEVHDYPYPNELEPGAVLLRMIASGICGTDKDTFRGEVESTRQRDGARGDVPADPGHENVGSSRRWGRAARTRATARGSSRATAWCPRPTRLRPCAACQRGFPYYLCTNLDSYGNALAADSAPYRGAAGREYLYLKPRTGIFRVPDSLPDDVAVLTEIFASPTAWSGPRRCPGRRASGGRQRRVHRRRRARPGAHDQGAADGAGRVPRSTHRRSGSTSPRGSPTPRPPTPTSSATSTSSSTPPLPRLVRGRRSRSCATTSTIIEVGAFVNMGEKTFDPHDVRRNLTCSGSPPRTCASTTARSRCSPPRRQRPVRGDGPHRFTVAEAPTAMEAALDAERSAKVLITQAERVLERARASRSGRGRVRSRDGCR